MEQVHQRWRVRGELRAYRHGQDDSDHVSIDATVCMESEQAVQGWAHFLVDAQGDYWYSRWIGDPIIERIDNA